MVPVFDSSPSSLNPVGRGEDDRGGRRRQGGNFTADGGDLVRDPLPLRVGGNGRPVQTAEEVKQTGEVGVVAALEQHRFDAGPVQHLTYRPMLLELVEQQHKVRLERKHLFGIRSGQAADHRELPRRLGKRLPAPDQRNADHLSSGRVPDLNERGVAGHHPLRLLAQGHRLSVRLAEHDRPGTLRKHFGKQTAERQQRRSQQQNPSHEYASATRAVLSGTGDSASRPPGMQPPEQAASAGSPLHCSSPERGNRTCSAVSSSISALLKSSGERSRQQGM